MKLIILESPNKTRTIKQYLNNEEYCVVSSNGHITELSKKGEYKLGVDLKKFEPDFIVLDDKKKILKNIKELSKEAKEIFLATDPDREGEAISYHLAKRLNMLGKIKRIFFNEVTKTAVVNALKKPTTINMNLVESQITRRILDRMMGFRLSNLLQRKTIAKSAGRVQSVALKIIVERQQEIEKFIPEKSWYLLAETEGNFIIHLTKKFIKKTKKWTNFIIKNKLEFEEIKQKINKSITVNNIIKKNKILNRPSPLKTAVLVQLASSQFKFSIKKTMALAQKLYEGVNVNGKLLGLITYPRTDSERISQSFYEKMSSFIKNKYGKEYLGDMAFSKKKQSKVKIQDAHESIHITGELMDLELAKEVLEKDLFRLYSLIYNYSLASVMKAAQFSVEKFELIDNDYLFDINFENIIFPGFLKILSPDQLIKLKNIAPLWKKNQKIQIKKITEEIKISKPKAQFTEGSLIKTLEKLGIGRPSTYATIVSKLQLHKYLDKKDNKLIPTKIGYLVNEKLKINFMELINEKYTYQLEQNLDKIAIGEKKRIKFLKTFWNYFDSKIKTAEKNMQNEKNIPIDNSSCPNCSKSLMRKQGRYGEFIACSGYPECRYIQKTEQKIEKVGRNCEKCQKELLKKQGRYGEFIACSGYPECRYIEKTTVAPEKVGRNCEECGKELLKKKGRYSTFVACSGYPTCRYVEKNK